MGSEMCIRDSVTTMLVAANDFKGALDRLNEGMKGTMADYEIVSIAETPLMDVYKANLGASRPTEAPAE